MAKNEAKLERSLPRGKPATRHGGYSFLTRGTLPENRIYLLRYLTAVREGLIQDLGPLEQDLSTQELILVDRCVSLLGVIRCIEEHVKERGVFNGGQLQPSLGKNYIAFTNSLQRILVVLGIERKDAERFLTPLQLAKLIDEEKQRKNPK